MGKFGGGRPDRKRFHTRSSMPQIDKRTPVIKIGNKSIKVKKTVKYLGVVIDKGFQFHSHCKYLRDKVTPLFYKLRKLAQRTWGLNSVATNIIYKAVFGPTVTYAAAGWAQNATVKNIKSLEGMQQKALLPVVHAYNTSPGDALCVISGNLPIEILLQQRIALYKLRKGQTAVIGQLELVGHRDSLEKENQIREETIKLWQSKWESSEDGRTTFAFFSGLIF